MTQRQTIRDITNALGEEYQFVGVETGYSAASEEKKSKIEEADIVFFEETKTPTTREEIDRILLENPRDLEKGRNRVYILLVRNTIGMPAIKNAHMRGFDGVINPAWDKEKILANVENAVAKSNTRILNIQMKNWIISCRRLGIFDHRIARMLRSLGIRADLRGYHYLKRGILLLFINLETMYTGDENQIYYVLAIIFRTLSSTIKHNIHYAINKGLERANPEILDELFGYSIDRDYKSIPTNQYMATIVDYLDMTYHDERLLAIKESGSRMIYFDQLLRLEYSNDGMTIREKPVLEDVEDIYIF